MGRIQSSHCSPVWIPRIHDVIPRFAAKVVDTTIAVDATLADGELLYAMWTFVGVGTWSLDFCAARVTLHDDEGLRNSQ